MFFLIILHYALIPFVSSVFGLLLSMFVSPYAGIVAVPILAAAIHFLFREKLDMYLAAKINAIAAAVLLVIFTVMMAIASGSVEGTLMSGFNWFVVPFAPIMLIYAMLGQKLVLHAVAILTYVICAAVSAIIGKVRSKLWLIPVSIAAVCIFASAILYANRPSAKYAGHGFDYMNGYSSTDFSDYMVYSKNSKLASPDNEPGFMIENVEDMPVMDGAEACYPLYAAFAKAVYKDIDIIEKEWHESGDNWFLNGRVVTFTNSISGFSRLLRDKNEEDEKYGERVDMFFGARPSASQLEDASVRRIELEITPIGREAFVFFVEEDNPIDDLTAEQLKAIYHGDITNWSELGGKNQKIMAFQRPKNSGSQTMMEYFMGDISLKEPQTYEKVNAMMGVVKEVAQYANERGAIGYSFRYFIEQLNQEKGVKLLSVNGIYPSLDNIENGSYPLTTNVCLITRKNDTNPNVRRMIDFILSDEGQSIVRKTGYAGAAN